MGLSKSKEKTIKEEEPQKGTPEAGGVTLKGIKHLEDHPEYNKSGDVSFQVSEGFVL